MNKTNNGRNEMTKKVDEKKTPKETNSVSLYIEKDHSRMREKKMTARIA